MVNDTKYIVEKCSVMAPWVKRLLESHISLAKCLNILLDSAKSVEEGEHKATETGMFPRIDYMTIGLLGLYAGHQSCRLLLKTKSSQIRSFLFT